MNFSRLPNMVIKINCLTIPRIITNSYTTYNVYITSSFMQSNEINVKKHESKKKN